MDIKKVVKDTAKVLASYLTYQAARTVVAQLSETNPPLAIWLSNFSTQDKIQDGEAYLQELIREKQDLALRIMTVRQHLAEEIVEFLPETVLLDIQQANMEHKRQHLERITQLTVVDPSNAAESEPNPSANLDNLTDR